MDDRTLSSITEQEWKTFLAVVEYGSRPEAARALGISVHTLNIHSTNFYRKIGAVSLANAVYLMFKYMPPDMPLRTKKWVDD